MQGLEIEQYEAGKDADDFELLKKYRVEFPQFLAFQDINDRSLSMQERFTEFELEKLCKKIEEMVNARKAGLTKIGESTGVLLPFLSRLKSVKEFRDDRLKQLKQLEEVPQPPPLALQADLFLKECALAGESLNTVQYGASVLLQYYRERQHILPHKKYKLLFRWSRYCNTTEIVSRCDPLLKSRLRQLEREYDLTQERIDRLAAYSQFISSKGTVAKQAAAQAPSAKRSATAKRLARSPLGAPAGAGYDLADSTLSQQYNLNHPTKPQFDILDFQIYLRDTIYQSTVTQRLRRFMKKLSWLSFNRRYELYTIASDHMLKKPAAAIQGKTSDTPTQIPPMATSDEEIGQLLEELILCFKLSGAEKSDTQEFFYSVNKRFAAVFNSQTAALVFPPYELREQDKREKQRDQAGAAEESKESTTVYLKHSNWAPFAKYTPEISRRQELQATRLSSILTLDASLRVESQFLNYTDLQSVVKRLKEQAETHMQRSDVRRHTADQPGQGPLSALHSTSMRRQTAQEPPEKKKGESKHDTSASHRRQSLYLLRYIRIREFKRKLLDLLNYFRSIERRITIDAYGFALPSEMRRQERVAKARPTATDAEGSSGVASPSPAAADPHVSPELAALAKYFDAPDGDGFTDEGRDSYTQAIIKYYAVPPDYAGSPEAGPGFGAPQDAESQQERESDAGLQMMRAAALENRDDTYVLTANKDLLVRDSNDVYVMYDAAQQDLEALENELLRVGTFYIKKYNSESEYDNVDRVGLLEDLYECETWFQDGKRKTVECLMEAYENVCNPQEQERLARAILRLVSLRPLLDTEAPYFASSYSSEIVSLELQYSLLRDVINAQISEERRAMQQISKGLGNHRDFSTVVGFPESSMQDTRLVMPLFPGSSVINIMDFYSSLGQICQLTVLLDENAEAICNRFQVENSQVVTNIKRAVLQHAMVEWRLLQEEEKIQRQMQMQFAEELEEHSLLSDVSTIDRLAVDLSQDNPTNLLRRVAMPTAQTTATPSTLAVPTSETGESAGGSSDEPFSKSYDEATSEANEEDASRVFHRTIGGLDSRDQQAYLFQIYLNVIDCIATRRSLLDNMYETEILYNIHRKQGKQMGVNVKRFNFEPIDFEKRKAFAEIDELEAEEADMNEVVSLRTEYLSNLAISEFEVSMAQFDFHSYAGIKKILSNGLGDLRRALQVQVVQRVMLAIVVQYNQVPLDLYYETKTWNRLHEGEDFTFLTNSNPPVAETLVGNTQRRSTSAKGAPPTPSAPTPQAPQRPPIDLETQRLRAANSVDHKTLQKLFVSVNHIKSIHRKGILGELTERTTEILGSKRPELMRKRMRELKYDLIQEYCQGIMLAMYSYAVKFQIVRTVEDLRRELLNVPHSAQLINCGFIYGKAEDQMRHVARHMDRQKRTEEKNACCLLAKDGRVEEPWYLPHFLQVYHLNWESEREKTLDDLKQHEHSHLHGTTHLKTNQCLVAMFNIIACFHSIMTYVKAAGKTAGPASLAANPAMYLDQVPNEFLKIQQELDTLVDGSDTKAVVEHLQNKRLTLHWKMITTLNTLRNKLRVAHATRAAAVVDDTLQRVRNPPAPVDAGVLQHCTLVEVATSLRFPEDDWRNAYARHVSKIHAFDTAESDVAANSGGPTPENFYIELGQSGLATGGSLPRLAACPDPFLFDLNEQERGMYLTEAMRVDAFLDEVAEEAKVFKGSNATLAIQHFMDALRVTLMRDAYKQFWQTRLMQMGVTESERSAEFLEEQFSKMVTLKARVLCERDAEAAEDDEHSSLAVNPRKRRGRRSERELRRKQVLVLRQEINKQLMYSSLQYLRSCFQLLSQYMVRMQTQRDAPDTNDEDADPSHPHRVPTKLFMFKEFVTSVLSRVVAHRAEGSDEFIFQIPESTIGNALDALGQRVREWQDRQTREIADTSESCIVHYKHMMFGLEQKVKFLELLRELDRKSMERRVQAKVTDEKYELIFRVDSLAKQNEDLNNTIKNIETIIRNKVKLEYDERLNTLKNEIMLVQGKFKDYKAKLLREMQTNLEEIKKGAMLQIGRSDVAPLHMKRQALRIAITDDEINKLKDENTELQLTITKLKLWHEMKIMNLRAMYEKKLAQAEQEKEESSSKYWGNKKAIEEKEELMKQQLAHTQNMLSQTEMEVEQLRKDLQLQLKNKKDLVSWKVMHSKMMDDMNKKVKKYEKWSQYDMDKLLLDLEKKKAEVEAQKSQAVDAQTVQQMKSIEVQKDKEIQRLRAQLQKESRLKTKAFQKLDHLRMSGSVEPTEDVSVWQRKYFECATELQRSLREVDIYRSHISQNGLPPPPPEALRDIATPMTGATSVTGSEFFGGNLDEFDSLPQIDPATRRKPASAPPRKPAHPQAPPTRPTTSSTIGSMRSSLR
eukprot:TRINITY_DN40584_c0_g1_i1.p1 TRINITY_DN40584_c0_g1~~TRINITY_DN40584_c0_g1_i1.p1  ORF type:complete len:2384 (-),score=596.24 TRINITY_DN40584_c0_g1_i1:67-7218(-)